MRIYREAGGTNAALANVAIDLANRPESAGLAEVPTSLVCPPDEARRRLKRIEQLGFDEVLLVSHASVLEDIERARLSVTADQIGRIARPDKTWN